VWVGVGVCGCVYKIENFRTLSAPSEIASLREAISSSAAFEKKNFFKKSQIFKLCEYFALLILFF
jgi:hypothetical protein